MAGIKLNTTVKLQSWIIQDTTLLYVDSNGQAVVFPAADIYHFVQGKKLETLEHGNLESPDIQVEHLALSRFPADLEIKAGVHPGAELYIAIVARSKDKSVEVNDFFSRTADHIVIDNVWYPFVGDKMQIVRGLLDEAGIDRLRGLTLQQFLVLRRLLEHSPVTFQTGENILDAQAFSSSIGAREFGPSFQGSLYPYQERGYHWLSWIADQNLGCILADQMGLGKSVQVIALIAGQLRSDSPSLIISPATLLENWRREFRKFAPGLQVKIHRGADRTGFPSELRQSDVLITSYETVVRDLPIFKMIHWNIVALDEAQAIKNPVARRTLVLKQLPRRVSVAVTGTPLENYLSDLWSIVDFAIPELLGSLDSFESEYGNTPEAAARLEPFVSPVILRRTVDEVAGDLPEKIDIPQPLEMPGTEAQGYELIRQEILNTQGTGVSLVTLTRLRMYCTHPFLQTDDTGDPCHYSAKYLRLTEILDEIFASQSKVLIFTSYLKMADILVSDIGNRFGVYCRAIDGRTEVADRQNLIDEFGEHPGAAVLILNPKAAGVGLNITAATHVIHYNLEWNPATEDQATARAHRRGQQNTVTVHRLFYVATIEEVISDRSARKRLMAQSAVVGVEGEAADYADLMKSLGVSPLKE